MQSVGTAALALIASALASCASAGTNVTGDDGGGDDVAPVDAAPDIDACLDTDGDGVCNHLDICPGADDAVDADADTVPDGCDDCPGLDDRVDTNGNMIPDCSELVTKTIDVKVVNGNYWRGWYNEVGSHTSVNDNTITGLNLQNYNSYFVFSLAGFSASTIQSVVLELEKENYSSSDASETISIWDVTTDPATLEATPPNQTIGLAAHNDLASGTTYGTGMVMAADAAGSLITVPLNAAAVTAIQGRLGLDFALGVHVDTQPGWVRFSAMAEARVARLQIRYLP